MARYFFNIYDGKGIYGNVGLDFSTVRAMRLHMLEIATDVAFNDPHQKDLWQVEVLDERGKIVCSMDFGLEIKGFWLKRGNRRRFELLASRFGRSKACLDIFLTYTTTIY